MAETTSNIPVGFCQCGCGLRTRVPTRNHQSKRGYHEFNGVPLRYIRGHAGREKHNPNRYAVQDMGYTSPCWVWYGPLNGNGYGLAYIPEFRKHRIMHILFWERKHGRPVPPGLELDHLCRVRKCVNPDHLEPVTHAENGRRGLLAKLNRDQVEEIKRRKEAGESLRALARAFGCTATNIGYIVKGKSWVKP
jgi:hypothetical protein